MYFPLFCETSDLSYSNISIYVLRQPPEIGVKISMRQRLSHETKRAISAYSHCLSHLCFLVFNP